ncbi:WecB/TagA/CpsF family glycosyltransferase [Xylocopilactobacillus apicola]|uniref:N-acetylglucosaminyldiphosphoundecaprenol N-acetyl-beta-D-mannosaminyltransferase n=1 Tax=Xylocopilactobacillus apicola TaxID=2932184 RepID=A0AAU9DCF6_9LACO|nr:WecB/TagA/CpsF family glycosyltransferase [Xylocopilactobacillus apicola]BDR59245.1 acetylglucosaminyldiphosphoundecaprenol acetyl-beta-D-mannosaminyltransferase [Xylocopilactobacillus apicola]
MKIQKILNFNFVSATNQEFDSVLVKRLEDRQNTFVVTANPEIVMYARSHPEFAKLISKSTYLTPDGIGIIYAGKQLKTPLNERITGYDTFLYLLQVAQEKHLKVLFYGAKPEVIAALEQKIKTEYPNIQIAGAFDGYLSDSTPVIECIKNTQPELVFVALGSPKQEEFIDQNLTLTTAIWLGIGGSFDAFTGKVKRAPKIIQKINLEWLYRLVTNPRRFKRYLAIPRFMRVVKQAKRDAAPK